MFCYSSMSVASGEGSLWDTAVAILMLRHSMKSVNVVLCSCQKTCGSGQGREVERPDAAQVRSLCARRRMTMRRPQKNGGTEVETFFLGVARDARAGWQQLGGGTEAIAECPQLLAWRQTSLPPRWAARFNTRGWRRDLDAGTLNCAILTKGYGTLEMDGNPAERQPRASDQAAA